VTPSGRLLTASVLFAGGILVTVSAQDAPPAASPAGVTSGAAAGKIWTGVYSAAQAERGKVPFTGVCRRCHADTLEGSRRGPALKGESFMADWEAQDLKRLFDKMRDTMPPDSPSSLEDHEYLDVMTYILQANGYPAGSKDLTPEMIDDIQIVRPLGSAPRQAQNFSVVEIVGCLEREGDGWFLTRTTEPMPSGARPATPAELTEAAARPLGTLKFRLLSVASFSPDAHTGEKMDAKGLLYRAPSKDRVNVSSLQPLGSACRG
jgi:mono/diheme cytochrome c family protein